MSGGGGDKVRGCRRGEEKEEGERRWRKEGKGQIKMGCNFQHERVAGATGGWWGHVTRT